MMSPITPPPREAVQGPLKEERLQPRRPFGGPIPCEPTHIDHIVAKDHSLQRHVPPTDGAKFDRNNNSGLLFKDSNSPRPTSTSDSSESPTLFTNPNLVSHTTVSSASPLFNNPTTTTAMHNNSLMDTPFNGSTASLDPVSGTFTHPHRPNTSDSDLEMEKLFDECLVGDFDEDTSFLYTPFTPYTTETSFTCLTSGLDTPSINLAQIDSYLNPTSFDQDFNLFGDSKAINTDEWNLNPLFNPGSLAEDPVASYALFKTNSATVSSASPKQFSFSSVGEVPKLELPSPELSPPTTRKSALRRPTHTKSASAARRVSTAPFTPITPAPTTPSTPQPVISRATKRRIPVIGEDPAVVEKRRRNTVAAQRSRARKAEEKAEDRARITQLEKEKEALHVLVSYWKDRACELGASPLEDGEN
jgi:hypothetical protein